MLNPSTHYHFEDSAFLTQNILEREGKKVFWLRPVEVQSLALFEIEGSKDRMFNKIANPRTDSEVFRSAIAALYKAGRLPVNASFRSNPYQGNTNSC